MKNEKKVFCPLMVFSLMVLLFFSCEKDLAYKQSIEELSTESVQQIRNSNEKGILKVANYDKKMQLLAHSIALSLKNEEFSSIVKSKSLLQWNGDYEFLYTMFNQNSMAKSNCSVEDLLVGNLSFENEEDIKKELISYYNDKAKHNEINQKSGKALKAVYLKKFSEDFPSMQIAVRGVVENWDLKTAKPLVVYIPSNFEDNWKEIDAIKTNGKIVKLDLTKDFEQPVVVLMASERTNVYGDLLPAYSRNNSIKLDSDMGTIKFDTKSGSIEPNSTTRPNAPTNVRAVVGTHGVTIDWDWSGSHDLDWIRFYIYRQGGTDNYRHISMAFRTQRSTRDYATILPSTQYRYYVKAVAMSKTGHILSYYSPASNWITTPNIPSNVVGFSAEPGVNCAYLKWQHPDIRPYHAVKISRKLPGQNFQQIAYYSLNTSNLSVSDYTAYNSASYRGQNIEYSIQTNSAYGASNTKYDVIRASDRQSGQNLYVTNFTVGDLAAIENRLLGKPELVLTVSHYNPGEAHQMTVLSNIQLGHGWNQDWNRTTFSNKSYSATVNRVIVPEWSGLLHKQVLHIHIHEDDANEFRGIDTFVFDLTKAVKQNLDSEGFKLNPAVNASIAVVKALDQTISIHKGNQNIGSNTYTWWSPINQVIQYDHGIKLKVSNTPYNGSRGWEPWSVL